MVIRNDVIIIDDVSVNFKILLWFLYFIVSKILVIILMMKSIREIGVFMYCRVVNGYFWLLFVILFWNFVSLIVFLFWFFIVFFNKICLLFFVYVLVYVCLKEIVLFIVFKLDLFLLMMIMVWFLW